MLWFWRYIMGFLIIKISGENSELLLNRAASNGIKIWNLTYKKGSIFGNISIKNFYRLRIIKRGLKSKISIIKKQGYFFRFKKYNRRIGLLIGTILFGVILFFLSNFVWIINIEGNNNITESEIIQSCKEIGIYEGIHKTKINNKYDSQKLQLNQKGIAWCSLNLEGSILTVNLSETAISDKEERKYPSNLKALNDGKIKKIDVTTGNTVVKVGDIVSKGDLLVSGVVENFSSTHFIHSDGIIVAETNRVFSSEGKYSQNKPQPTGKTVNRYTLKFFGIKIPLYLGNFKKSHNYIVSNKTLKLFGKKIPIEIAHEQYDVTENTEITFTDSMLENQLYDDIIEQVENFNFISATQVDKDIVKTEKGILMKIEYICEENIALQDKILLHTQN